jgi:hypothetical protein
MVAVLRSGVVNQIVDHSQHLRALRETIPLLFLNPPSHLLLPIPHPGDLGIPYISASAVGGQPGTYLPAISNVKHNA